MIDKDASRHSRTRRTLYTILTITILWGGPAIAGWGGLKLLSEAAKFPPRGDSLVGLQRVSNATTNQRLSWLLRLIFVPRAYPGLNILYAYTPGEMAEGTTIPSWMGPTAAIGRCPEDPRSDSWCAEYFENPQNAYSRAQNTGGETRARYFGTTYPMPGQTHHHTFVAEHAPSASRTDNR